jgi:hypothetical protein
MKRIENLNVRSVRTQGIVRDDGITCTCTAWFRQAAFLLIARDGSIAASASSFLSAYLAPGFGTSS